MITIIQSADGQELHGIYCACKRCRADKDLASLEKAIAESDPNLRRDDPSFACALFVLAPCVKEGLGQDSDKIADWLSLERETCAKWAANLRENGIWREDGKFGYGEILGNGHESDVALWVVVLCAEGEIVRVAGADEQKPMNDQLTVSDSDQPAEPLTPAQRTRKWKNRKIAEGLCAHCFKAKAGENGGSLKLCGDCRKRNKGRHSLEFKQEAMRRRKKAEIVNNDERNLIGAETSGNAQTACAKTGQVASAESSEPSSASPDMGVHQLPSNPALRARKAKAKAKPRQHEIDLPQVQSGDGAPVPEDDLGRSESPSDEAAAEGASSPIPETLEPQDEPKRKTAGAYNPSFNQYSNLAMAKRQASPVGDKIYASYIAMCERIEVRPADYETWLRNGLARD